MLSLSGRDFNDTDYSIDRCAALKFCPGALDLIDMSKKNQVLSWSIGPNRYE